MQVNFLEAVGAISLLSVAGTALYKLRTMNATGPVYTWNTCPNDHDTMARYGAKRCDKCGSTLMGDDDDDDEQLKTNNDHEE